MTREFHEAVDEIDGIPKFVKKNTMEDTKAFYRKLSCPCRDFKVIHVAGTNGKGSVCAYLQSVLMEAGYRVGLFTSPHLVDIRERIRVDDALISEAEFVAAYGQVREACGAVEMQNAYHPSYFEYLYFMAMLYFEKKRPDFVILETGLGGRLDATNSFETPCLCIITEIGLDHTEYLGGTIAEIAGEKAGIVKKGVPLVYFAKDHISTEIFEKSAKRAEARAFSVKGAEIALKKYDEKGIDFSYYSGYYKDSTFHLATSALYQQENAALCVKAFAVLGQGGLAKVSEDALRRGLARARWAGRMEEMRPGIFVDGAHNEDGIKAFLESVRADGGKEGRLLLYSALAEKACGEMAAQIAGAGLFEEIVVTKIENGRAAKPDELAELFYRRNMTTVSVMENVEEAFRYCLRRRAEGVRVYIAGSLYLVGQIKALEEAAAERRKR